MLLFAEQARELHKRFISPQRVKYIWGEDTGAINGKCQNDKRFHKVCGMHKRERSPWSLYPFSLPLIES